MSEKNANDSQEQKPKARSFEKLIVIFAAGAFLLSLLNTILIVMNPAAAKVEQFNEELKTDLAESVATLHKKVDGLRTAEVEWQMVLKKAKEQPDATYKIANTQDGYLTLMEIQSAAAPAEQ
jgi:galactose-1-phosphate uridylyltransferase